MGAIIVLDGIGVVLGGGVIVVIVGVIVVATVVLVVGGVGDPSVFLFYWCWFLLNEIYKCYKD